MAIPGARDAASAPLPGGAAPPREALRNRARALLFAASVLFGLSAVLARVATRGGMNGGQVTLVRFSIGVAALAAVFATRPAAFQARHPWLLASRGGFGGISALLYFLAIERIPAGEATLLNNTFPIWAVLISLVVLNERPTFHLAVALLLASAGVFLVLGGGGVRLGLGTGELVAVISGVSGGAAVTSIRALRQDTNALTIFFAFAVGGLLVAVPFAFDAWPSAPLPWLAAAAVGIVAALAQLSMTEAYGALSVPEAALWQNLTPIASYLWALALVGEPIGVVTVLGVLLGIAGIVYGSVLGHRPRDARAPEAKLAAGLPAEEP